MNIATGTFGPFDVCTLREIVERLDQYSEMDQIYVKDVKRLESDTPAIVRSDAVSVHELEGEMNFRLLAEVDDAREALDSVGRCRSDQDWCRLVQMIDEYGM